MRVTKMLKISGYKGLKQKDEDRFSKYYLGYSSIDEKDVIIQKIKEPSYYSQYQFEHIQRELDLLFNIQHPSIAVPIRLEKKNNETFPIYNPFEGVPYKKFVYSQRYSLKDFFALALQFCEIIEYIHDQDFMFLHLNPYNFIINVEETQVFLLGIFNSLQRGKSIIKDQFLTSWEVAYIPPELTGRINIQADYRANLYTLGIIFYELLTKKLPFEALEPSETIHSHLARIPRSPSVINSDIPEILSTIILKLLEKSPDERYQTINSVKKDIKYCYDEFNKTGWVKQFPLNHKNENSKQINDVLYGREKEIDILSIGLEKAFGGSTRTALISGPSGSGKTRLVHFLQSNILEEDFFFLEGKFDQLHRNIPYSPIIQAFKTWVRIIISKGETNIITWKSKILHELGPYVSALSFLLPEIEWIIGKQPVIEGMSSYDNHSHYLTMFHKLINLISMECPLIIFIDDLQWSDAASLELICYLINNNRENRLFLIIAYRDGADLEENKLVNTVLTESILTNLNDKIVISLQPLSKTQIMHWISIQFDINTHISKQISSIIYKVTSGNPFFITQIFRSLTKEMLLSPDDETFEQIQLTLLNEISSNEDIVSFIISRIKKLPEHDQKLLKAASCFGRKVNGDQLAASLKIENHIIVKLLQEAVTKGFVVPIIDNNSEEDINQFLFIHDRVQQALYSLLSMDEKYHLHLTIGRYLKANRPIHFNNEDLFETVSHMNFCSILLSEEEREELAALNARAGGEAIKAAAFQAAYNFFTEAKGLLQENSWQKNYPLTFEIIKGLGESAYLNSEFKLAEHAFREVIDKAQTKEEKIKLYNNMIMLFTHLHRVNEAVDAGLKGLQLFNWKIKLNPGKLDIAKELLLIQLTLINKNPATLLDLPEMKEPSHKLFIETLINLNAPSFHSNQNLSTYLMLKAFHFTLKNGQTDFTSLVFNNYSLIQSAGFGNFSASYDYGNIALQHVERSNRINLKARVYFVFGTFVNHWKNPLHGNLSYLEKSQRLSVESGNIHLAGATSSFIILTLLLKGEELNKVLTGVHKQLEFVKSINYRLSVDFINEMEHWLNVLMNKDVSPNFDMPITNNDQSSDVIHYTLRLQMAFLLKEEEQAINILQKLSQLITKTNVLVMTPDYYFYHTLWLSRLYEKATKKDKKIYIRRIKRNTQKMKKWAENSPANYKHKFMLMQAELYRLLDKSKELVNECYEKAAFLAGEAGFLHDEAIIYECMGDHYIRAGYKQLAQYFFKMAYQQYLNWGAIYKAEDIRKQNLEMDPYLNEKAAKGVNIDMETIIKAAQAISMEINYEELMIKMMKIMIENAGAEKGYLILHEEGRLHPAIKGVLDNIIILDNHLDIFELGEEMPLQLIHYVLKTEEAIVLENAGVLGLFTDDPYVKLKKPKSVLSLPIIYQNILIGILYLENNIMTHAFTKESIQMLTILSSQAAISLVNSRVYTMLEDKVKERTNDLQVAITSLAEANNKLEQEEKLRRDFLANISHDLRTPITSVQGYIEAILDGIIDSPEKQLSYLKRSRERILSLNRLIQDLFDLSQLTAGSFHFSMENVAVNKLFMHLCGQYEWDVKRNHLDFIVTMPKLMDLDYPLVSVDVRRMDQLISNLINNSIKYTKKGKIQLELIIKETSDYVCFAIHDTGAGIEPDDLHTIFARSYTKKGQATETGHGLGLAICKEIIRNHSGEIWAESELNRGTSIYFTLPVIKVNEDDLLLSYSQNG